MNRIQVPPWKEEQLAELEELYQKTEKPRYRTRAQMVLLSGEQGLKAEEIAQIVREVTSQSYVGSSVTWQKGLKDCRMHPDPVAA